MTAKERKKKERNYDKERKRKQCLPKKERKHANKKVENIKKNEYL